MGFIKKQRDIVLLEGDCLDMLKTIQARSVDALEKEYLEIAKQRIDNA